MKRFLLFLSILFFLSCSPSAAEHELVNAFASYDYKSPVLLGVISESEALVRLCFNETVYPYESSFGGFKVYSDGCDVLVSLDGALKPGKSRTLSGRVCDLHGNSTGVSVNVWGYNSNPALVLINEFTTKGSSANPDRTELLVTKQGSLEGFVVYDGIPGNYRSSVMLSLENVPASSYVVIWWTKALPDSVSEHPSANVWNICANCESALSDNNGILTISSSPSEGAFVLDCLAYSTGESVRYDGFGTKDVYERICTAREKSWLKTEVLSPKTSTATRSLSRNENTGEWFVTSTGGSTFGGPNT